MIRCGIRPGIHLKNESVVRQGNCGLQTVVATSSSVSSGVYADPIRSDVPAPIIAQVLLVEPGELQPPVLYC